jgi:hypothetical protein
MFRASMMSNTKDDTLPSAREMEALAANSQSELEKSYAKTIATALSDHPARTIKPVAEPIVKPTYGNDQELLAMLG